MSVPSFSLIVATRNRPEALRAFLESLMIQHMPDLEVIVVDQSEPICADLNLTTCEAFEGNWHTRYVRQDGVGLSRARNLGLTLAQGRRFAFPDDDCRYPEGLLSAVSARLDGDSQLNILAGAYGDGRLRPAHFPDRPSRLNKWNAFNRLASVSLFFDPHGLPGLRFDEGLGAGTALPAAEELDFVLRALSNGWRGYFDPSILVLHAVSPADAVSSSLLLREKANAYVLARHSLEPGGRLLLARIAYRFLTDLLRAIAVTRYAPRFRARALGYRAGLLSTRHRGGERP